MKYYISSILFLKSDVYVIAYPNSDNKFLSEILDLYLDFAKLTMEKLDFHTQVVPNLLESFSIPELRSKTLFSIVVIYPL
jgi:hypothetical protein